MTETKRQLNKLVLETRLRFLEKYGKDWWALVLEKSKKRFFDELLIAKYLTEKDDKATTENTTK